MWSAGCLWRWRKTWNIQLCVFLSLHYTGSSSWWRDWVPFRFSPLYIPLTSWRNFKFHHCTIISLLSVALLEKKVDDKLRRYSLEGETHLPGVLGVHAVALLQQHEGLWSHGLRIKYGLLGTLKNRENKSIPITQFSYKICLDLFVCLEHNRKISVNL